MIPYLIVYEALQDVGVIKEVSDENLENSFEACYMGALLGHTVLENKDVHKNHVAYFEDILASTDISLEEYHAGCIQILQKLQEKFPVTCLDMVSFLPEYLEAFTHFVLFRAPEDEPLKIFSNEDHVPDDYIITTNVYQANMDRWVVYARSTSQSLSSAIAGCTSSYIAKLLCELFVTQTYFEYYAETHNPEIFANIAGKRVACYNTTHSHIQNLHKAFQAVFKDTDIACPNVIMSRVRLFAPKMLETAQTTWIMG